MRHNGYTKKRKGYVFNVDGKYYQPLAREAQEIFNGNDSAACVIYTKVVEDKGWFEERPFELPQMTYYDNGLIGYQCYDFYNTIDEAREALTEVERMTPKTGVVAYVDIWMAVNNK